jgi:ketosteroid isomerase-like protein
MKKVFGWFVGPSVCAASVLAMAATAGAAQDTRVAIEAANARFATLFKQADGAGVAALYTSDAQVFPANSDIVSGRAAIQKFWQGVMDSGIKGAKLTTLEVTPAGDTVYEVGRYELSGADLMALDAGKYVVIWKRDGGQWKLHRDIWNTNAPAPAK